MTRLRIAACLAALLSAVPGWATAGDVLVFAAASLREALEEVTGRWQTETGNTAIISLAGSSTLARQIQAGAPADLFISANVEWMEVLERDGFLRDGTRRDLLTNTLVIVAHDADAPHVDFSAPEGLSARIGDGWLAMALVDAVPAGIYGKTALEALGWWEPLAPRVAQADNVRAALALVATGEAPLGIVYGTDALAEPRVTLVGTFPQGSYPPIRYPMAIPAQSVSPDAQGLANYLAGPEAAEIFRSHGFGLAGQGGQ